MVARPIEAIIIQRVPGSITDTTVIKIPPVIAEHNVMFELLKHLRREHPGAWYRAEEWCRETYKGPVTVPVNVGNKADEIIKEVSREHWGLPPEDKIGDVKA